MAGVPSKRSMRMESRQALASSAAERQSPSEKQYQNATTLASHVLRGLPLAASMLDLFEPSAREAKPQHTLRRTSAGVACRRTKAKATRTCL